MKKIILLLLLFTGSIIAQELDASVIVNYEQLETSYRDKIANFATEVEEYLNNNKFSGADWEWDRIKCNFNIFFTSGKDETKYSAQVVVSSQRRIDATDNSSLMLGILDNSWSFNYEIGQSMYYSINDFDPLTSFLDYYAYIIIGLDSDSYDPLGGTDYFNEAYKVAQMGASHYGWDMKRNVYNKRGLVDELTNAKYQQFREDYCDYHMDGIDIFMTNKSVAQKNIYKLLKNLYSTLDERETRSVLLKVFFDAKHKEIVEYLKEYDDPELEEMLIKLDPAHIAKYNEAFAK